MALAWLLWSFAGSGPPLVLVVQTTKNRERHVLSPGSGAVHHFWSGNPLLRSLMRPAGVEVRAVLVEHELHVALSEDDNAGQCHEHATLGAATMSCWRTATFSAISYGGLRRWSCTNPLTTGAGRRASCNSALADVSIWPRAARTRAWRTSNTVRGLSRSEGPSRPVLGGVLDDPAADRLGSITSKG